MTGAAIVALDAHGRRRAMSAAAIEAVVAALATIFAAVLTVIAAFFAPVLTIITAFFAAFTTTLPTIGKHRRRRAYHQCRDQNSYPGLSHRASLADEPIR